MTLKSHLKQIAAYNLKTLRDAPFSEISGALGDLGTLLPLMIAMALQGSIDLPSTLVFSGLTNIVTGSIYGIPLPVQPMKAIASVAISQHFSKAETAAAGLSVAIAVFLLSVTGLLRWLNLVVPVPIVKGIQVGAGLNLVISAGSSLIKPLDWAHPALDNRLWALAAFLLLVVSSLRRRVPYALMVFLVGIIFATASWSQHHDHPAFWHPSFHIPGTSAWEKGAIEAALPQLPLTTLNSILAVTSLSASLFPSFPPTPSTTSIGLSVAFANLIGCWFHAMPICHGSGGLAGQYRFGARSGASIILLGLVKLLLGLFAGDTVTPFLHRFPRSILGVMVLAAGVELAKVGRSVADGTDDRDVWTRAQADAAADSSTHSAEVTQEEQENRREDKWMVMLVTVAGCLAFKNDAVGFLAGMIWHFSLYLPSLWERLAGRWLQRGHVRLQDEA